MPREPGTTSYFAIRIDDKNKPMIEQVSDQAGQALIDSRDPAPLH